MLNLMYHYIFPKSFEKSLNGIKFTSQEKFRKQIIKLKKKYTFINPEELNDIDTRSINKNLCSVTFDDGTKDQFEYAIPILNEFNIKAFFFIIGSVFDKKIPNSHLLHILLNYKSEKYILSKINKIFFKNKLDFNRIYKISKVYNYEKNKMRRILKFVLNFELKNNQYQINQFLIDELDKCSNAHDLIDNWFGNENDIKQAIKNGHYIGNHTYTHNYYGGIKNMNEIKNDINQNHELIKKKFNFKTRSYCHPQGGDNDIINMEVSKYLKSIGYQTCFKAVNSGKIDKMNLPRIDNIYLD
jgi:peptidoglycan/xylan/chitin deacetylase (PgdA/CDA1 family)